MSREIALTVAFIEHAPRAAAQELQRLAVDDAAALVSSVPTRLCAPVLHSMIPWHAARLLESIPAGKAGAIIRQLSFADSVTLARLVTLTYRDALIDALPTRYGRRLRSALEYPQHQVGAWIDPDVPTLNVNDTTGDALRVLRAASIASHVFLESADHEKFVGLISVSEILRSEPSVRLGQLPLTDSKPIANRATLASLAFDERWDDFLYLPVVGRRGNLLGGLSRKTLRHALHEQHVSSTGSQGSLLRVVLAALSISVSGIVGLVTEKRPYDSVGPMRGPANER
jgi:Mg/Co/Ni transporter MgtE